MSAFVISQRADGNFKFTFASRKGKTIFTSISCRSKSDCEKMIEAIKGQTADFTFSKMRTGSGKYFFRISRNGLVLATSRKFSTELMLKKGIEQILKDVSTAVTLDFSENEPVFSETENTIEERLTEESGPKLLGEQASASNYLPGI